MDMLMPVLDGYKAVSLLRAGGHARPVIALTAHPMESDRQNCVAAGYDGFASNPIDRWRLLETIQVQRSGTRSDEVANRSDLSPVPTPWQIC